VRFSIRIVLPDEAGHQILANPSEYLREHCIIKLANYQLSMPSLESLKQGLFWVFSTMKIQHPCRRLSGG
jgi:hypothetical protein